MTTLTLSPDGQITLPPEILQSNPWKNLNQLVMLHLGDILVLRPASSQKTDDISDLGGFFKQNTFRLTTEELCQPVNLTEEPRVLTNP